MAPKAGIMRGADILKKIAYSLRPSMRPASRKSLGIPTAYCRKKKIAKGETMKGRSMPAKVFMVCSVVMSLYRGRMRI